MKETRKPQPLLTGMNVCMFGCEWVCKGCILMQSSFFYCTTKCSQFWSRYFVLNVKASMSLFLILIKDFLLTKTPRERNTRMLSSLSFGSWYVTRVTYCENFILTCLIFLSIFVTKRHLKWCCYGLVFYQLKQRIAHDYLLTKLP